MKLRVSKADFPYTVEIIQEFLDAGDAFFTESVYHFYPELRGLSKAEVAETLLAVYRNKEAEMDVKALAYQAAWDEHGAEIVSGFEGVFSLDLSKHLNDMQARVCLNPICPRYLDTHTFDIFYLFSGMGSLEMVVHEVAHFVWFMVWNRLFQDSPEEYDTPHLKWVFSEIAIDPIVLDARLRRFTRGEQPAYSYFYDIMVDGQNFMEMIRALYRENDMAGFMAKGYALCQKHEAAIREVME